MASTLPDERALGENPTPRPSDHVVQQEGDIVAARNMQAAANEIGNAGDVIYRANEAYSSAQAEDAINKLNQKRVELEDAFNKVHGGDVGGDFYDRQITQFNASRDNIASGLDGEAARKYGMMAKVPALQYDKTLLEHKSRETEAFLAKTANDSVAISQNNIAQHPSDSLTFNVEMSKINGITNTELKRQGYSEDSPVAKEVRSKQFDIAMTSRIEAVMNGVPGVAEPNPPAALEMFKQYQNQLGVDAQTVLAPKVENMAKNWDVADVSQKFINGLPVTRGNNTYIVKLTGDSQADEKNILQMANQYAKNELNGNPLYTKTLDSDLRQQFYFMRQAEKVKVLKADNDMMAAIMGVDGKGGIGSLPDLMKRPDLFQEYSNSTNEQKNRYIQMMVQSSGRGPLETSESIKKQLILEGMSVTNPDGFSNLPPETFSDLPVPQQLAMGRLQMSVAQREKTQEARSANVLKAVNEPTVRAILDASGITHIGKKAAGKDFDEFVGKFQPAIEDWQAQNKRAAQPADLRAIASRMTIPVSVPSNIFGTYWPTEKPAFKVQPGETVIKKTPATPKNAADMAKIKSGETFINPADGKHYVKN